MAKEATGWRRQRGRRGRWIEQDTDSTAPTPHFMRSLKAATKSALTKQIQQRWRMEWHHESRGRAVYKLTPQTDAKDTGTTPGTTSRLSSVITQMRTEKIGLRQFLYQRHVPGVEDGQCECGRGSQTVRHVLLACPRHTVLRRRIWGEVPGRRIEGKDLKEILNTPAQATKAAKFMILTRLLGQFGAVSKDEIMQDEHWVHWVPEYTTGNSDWPRGQVLCGVWVPRMKWKKRPHVKADLSATSLSSVRLDIMPLSHLRIGWFGLWIKKKKKKRCKSPDDETLSELRSSHWLLPPFLAYLPALFGLQSLSPNRWNLEQIAQIWIVAVEIRFESCIRHQRLRLKLGS